MNVQTMNENKKNSAFVDLILCSDRRDVPTNDIESTKVFDALVHILTM